MNINNVLEIKDGVCSQKTEQLLMQPKKCVKILQNEPELIWRNLLFLLHSMCKTEITRKYFKILTNLDEQPLPNDASQTARFGIFHTVREVPNTPISLNLNFGKLFVIS